MAVHVALLRGINVGGKNMIKMPALKACFKAGGFEDVVTYIQSGNVLFRGNRSGAVLATRIEKMLSRLLEPLKLIAPVTRLAGIAINQVFSTI